MKINTNKQFNETKHKFLTSEDENFRFYSGMKFTDEYMNEMISQSVSIKYKDLRPENFSNLSILACFLSKHQTLPEQQLHQKHLFSRHRADASSNKRLLP